MTLVQPQPPPAEKLACPGDLKLTEDQQATLETAMIPPEAIAYLTRRFVVKAIADPDDKRTLAVWRKSLAVAISGNWNNSKIREEMLRAPAPGLIDHERRRATPERSAPRPRRAPEPAPLPASERLEMAEEALAKLGDKTRKSG